MSGPRIMKSSRLISVVATYAMDIAHSATPIFPHFKRHAHYRFHGLVDGLDTLLVATVDRTLDEVLQGSER